VTDHRVGLSVYSLDRVLDGDLDQFVEELTGAEQAERLEALGD
jgi:peptide chain release factor 1